MADSTYSPPEPLESRHDRDTFECGAQALDQYLQRYAGQNQKRGIVRNYVTCRTGTLRVAAYYSLVYSQIPHALLPAAVTKGLGKYDIPVMLLARLAVDRREQGHGLGRCLLKDATVRTLQAAEIAGLKLLVVRAKDTTASAFYAKHGFVALSNDPLHLFLPISLGK